MNEKLKIIIDDDKRNFFPGETISGEVKWSFPECPDSVELRLFWYTQGKGDGDIGIVETVGFAPLSPAESHKFRIILPDSPYSFSGRLISLCWALELVSKSPASTAREEIVLSPTGEEIVLGMVKPQKDLISYFQT